MFLPESIDLEHSEKYILSIRIKKDGFMFSIHDPENPKNYCLRETTFSTEDNLLSNVQRIIFELSFLTQEYKQTNVIFVSGDYDLIPAIYLEKEKRTNLYNFTHFDKADYTKSSLIDSQDIVTVYKVEKELVDFLSRNLWSPHFFHHSNLMINWLEKRGQFLKNISKMYVSFHEDVMDVYCFSGSQLLHSLTYENETPANQVYYMLKLWEQLGFDQQADSLYILGQPDRLIVARAQLYISKIEELAPPSEIYLWNEDAQKAPLDLLTLSL